MCALYKPKIIGISSDGEPITDSIIVNRDCFGRNRNVLHRQILVIAKFPRSHHWLRAWLQRSTNFDRRAAYCDRLYNRSRHGWLRRKWGRVWVWHESATILSVDGRW